MTSRKKPGSDSGSPRENIGAIFKGLGEIMDRLGDLGGELTRRFEFSGTGEKQRPWKGVYGFSVKVGGQGGGVKVEPFGNVQRGKESAAAHDSEAPVHEVREPIIDTFEEEEVYRIIAEMPGISEKDLVVELEGDILTFSAKSGDKHYRKEVLLPRTYRTEGMTVVCNNGLVDIQLKK